MFIEIGILARFPQIGGLDLFIRIWVIIASRGIDSEAFY